MPTIVTKLEFQEFDYGVETIKRKRPHIIEATTETVPVKTTPRTMGPFPLALKAANGDTDFYPHNTVGGHLLGLQFGGPHSDTNLVPMFGHFNNGGAWSKCEKALFDELYAPDTVGDATVRIQVNLRR